MPARGIRVSTRVPATCGLRLSGRRGEAGRGSRPYLLTARVHERACPAESWIGRAVQGWFGGGLVVPPDRPEVASQVEVEGARRIWRVPVAHRCADRGHGTGVGVGWERTERGVFGGEGAGLVGVLWRGLDRKP